MNSTFLKNVLTTILMLVTFTMIPSTAVAEDVIACTPTQMQAGGLFARLLEDIHMYALLKTNPLQSDSIEQAYINALIMDGENTANALGILLAPELGANIIAPQFSSAINSFFFAGLEFVNGVVAGDNKETLNQKKVFWYEKGVFIVRNFQSAYFNFSTTDSLLGNLEQIVSRLSVPFGSIESSDTSIGKDYAAKQVPHYFEKTAAGYQTGLDDNCGASQFAVAFGIYLAKTAKL